MKEYSLVIASNFVDHYMYELSIELKKYFKDFYFVASEELEEKYSKLGFADLNNSEFVVKAYEDKQKARELILNADILVTGSYKYLEHLYERKKANKDIVYYSERLFKYNKVLNIASALFNRYKHRFDTDDILLCVSAYATGDYNKAGLFKNRTYEWGYFPKAKKYENVNELINKKKKNSIFWAGRLIDWKHPDDAVMVAKKLKEEGIRFELNIAGNGPMEEQLKSMIEANNLSDCVHMLGSMPPEKIREYMEASEIYLFTSDKGEGWGVVLNEAMNSACICVASYEAGSTPFLIKENNGFEYYNHDFSQLYEKTKSALSMNNKDEMMLNAYNTIINEFSPEMAAKRLYEFINTPKKERDSLFKEGILSKTKCI